MATSNILVFNENQNNTMSDATYKTDSQRLNGLTSGIAKSSLLNKVMNQTSIVCAAIGNLMSYYGYDCLDTNLDKLTTDMISFWQDGIIGDTISSNEGLYRNLLLTSNISDNVNNIALGADTPYDLTYGLGYALIYFANINNDTYIGFLKKCNNRQEIANNVNALAAIYDYDLLRDLWRKNLFLSAGKIVKETTVVNDSIDSSGLLYTNARMFILEEYYYMLESKNAVSSTNNYYSYYSNDSGSTFTKFSHAGSIKFSSDNLFWYIIKNKSSDGGVDYYSGYVDDFDTIEYSGNLSVKYGSLYNTAEFVVFDSAGFYWLFSNWNGGASHAWAEAYFQSSPLQLSVSGTANIHSGIGYDNWVGVYNVGECILAIWEGKTVSSASNGEQHYCINVIYKQQVKATKDIKINYINYGSIIKECNVQFKPDDTNEAFVYVYIYDENSGNKIEEVYVIDGAGNIHEANKDSLIYSIDYNTRYVCSIKESGKYKIAADSDGYIILDNLSTAEDFEYPSDITKKIQIIPTSNMISNSTNSHDYYKISRYIEYDKSKDCYFYKNYYVLDNKLYKENIYIDVIE